MVDNEAGSPIENIGKSGGKIGFHGETAVIQASHIADPAALGTMTTVGANTGTGGAGLSLVETTQTTDESAELMNDLKALQEDIGAIKTAVDSNNTAIDSILVVLENLGLVASA